MLTHGFTLDDQGEKMSKSKGNTTDPLKVISESGAEILRLWVAMVDYAEDQRIGKAILQTATDGYRKFRNTLRYLLGALAGFDDAERVDAAGDAAAGALRPAPAVGARRPSPLSLRRVPVQRRLAAGVGVRRPGTVGALLSTSARTRSTATRRRACAAAPPAR